VLCLCLAWAGVAQASLGAGKAGHEPTAAVFDGGHAEHCGEHPDEVPSQDADQRTSHCSAACASACVISAAAAVRADAGSPARMTDRFAPYAATLPEDAVPDAFLRPPRLFS